MEGIWPVIIDGVECGSVTASRQGAYTVFSAEATYSGGLVRLSLYGSGSEGYLGVLAPDSEGRQKLTRRFTRAQLTGFPDAPEYAARAGSSPPEKPRPDEEPIAPESDPAAEPDTAPPGGGDVLWYSSPDGTLSRHDGRLLLVPLPAENVRVPKWAGHVVQRINGREYVVFPR